MHPKYVLTQESYEVFTVTSSFWKAFLYVRNQDLKQHLHSCTQVHLEHNREISRFFDGGLVCVWLAG